MPNAIKYNTSAETLALKKGNFYIGTGDVGKGPTSSTGYYNGITPPTGGYTIYLNKETGGPSIYTASNDAQLISLTNSIAGQSYTTVNQCLVYFAGQTDKLCVNRDYEGIVTDGLVLNLDAGFTPSYPTSGATCYDISTNTNNGTLTNGPTFSTNDGGLFELDGADDEITFNNNTDSIFKPSTLTLSVWVYPTNAAAVNQGHNIVSTNDVQKWRNGYGIFTYPYQSLGPQVNTFIGDGNNPTYIQVLISNNTWYNFTTTYDGTYHKFYVNSVLEGTLTRTLVYEPSNGFNIGRGLGYNSYYQGSLSNVKLYNKALTSQEILQNYNAQKGRFGL